MRAANAETEQLALDGITLVEIYSEDASTDGMSGEDVEGVILYAQLLEAMIVALYAGGGTDTGADEIRKAARTTASAWRKRPRSDG